MRVRRRDLLKLGAWAASTALFSPSWTYAQATSREPRAAGRGGDKVLIIGAGLSGLVAAYELTKLGYDVMALEPQHRVGGRVLTLREPWADDVYVEAGAARTFTGFNGFGHSDTPQQIWHFTHDQPDPRGLLVSFIAGPEGEKVGAMEPEQRVRFVIDQMERAHPGLKQNLENLEMKVWHQDPWTKGALGQMTGLLLDAEKPEGRIHFAGEHLSRLQGWMQGALESGLRAMGEVHEAARA